MAKKGVGKRIKEPGHVVKGLFKYFKMRFFGDSEPFGCSLAPTIRCNLDCPHCYEQINRRASGGKRKEMTLEEMDALADGLARRGIRHCTITDGEPLIDRRSVEKVEAIVDHFWVNYLVTNGTRELPDLEVMYIVSLDGPPRVHDALRGDGVFDRLRRNVRSSPTDLIYGLCTLDRNNRGHIEDTVRTARDLGLRGIMFNWKNPLSLDDPSWVPFVERNLDIDEILGLRDQYDDLVCNTPFELDHLREPGWGAACPNGFVESYDAFGKRKLPCIFGEVADCERCGCHVFPALQEAVAGRPSVEFRLILDHISKYWFDLSSKRLMGLVDLQARS